MKKRLTRERFSLCRLAIDPGHNFTHRGYFISSTQHKSGLCWNLLLKFLSSVQVQIHGPLSLSENVECIVVNPRHQKEALTTKLLDRFVEKNKCNLIWMDSDDQSGAAPSSAGSSAGSLSLSHRRRPVRTKGLPRKHR